jgi:hypothetical protein
MAKREISIVLKAKNELAVGLAKAKDAITSFGESALSIGKWVGGAFIAAGAAIGAFAAKALSAYAAQEAATNSVRAAFRAYGEEVDQNTKAIQELSSAIQDETGVADENIGARVARLKMLGVETKALGDAARATVALAAYGMEEEAAIKAVAQAREGNFGMLERYIPALRSATTETEKAAIVNDYLTRGYAAQKEQLGTISGAWVAFKGRIGDVWEEFGALIAQGGTVTRMLDFASEKIKQFGLAIAEYAKSEQFKEIQMSIEGIINAIAKGGPDRQAAIVAIGEYLKAALSRGAEIAGELLTGIAPKIGALIGGAAKAALGSIAQENRLKEAASQLGIETPAIFAPFGRGFFGVTEAQAEAIKKQAALNYQTEIYKGLGLDIQKNTDGQTAAQARLSNATAALLQLGQQHGQITTRNSQANIAATQHQINLIKSVSDEQTKSSSKRVETESQTLNSVINSNTNAKDRVQTMWRESLENYKAFEAERIKATEEAANGIISANQRAASSSTDLFGNPRKGGSFETSGDRAQAIRNLQARGAIPASGTVLNTVQSEAIQRAILAELQTIRSQNTQLLTFS